MSSIATRPSHPCPLTCAYPQFHHYPTTPTSTLTLAHLSQHQSSPPAPPTPHNIPFPHPPLQTPPTLFSTPTPSLYHTHPFPPIYFTWLTMPLPPLLTQTTPLSPQPPTLYLTLAHLNPLPLHHHPTTVTPSQPALHSTPLRPPLSPPPPMPPASEARILPPYSTHSPHPFISPPHPPLYLPWIVIITSCSISIRGKYRDNTTLFPKPTHLHTPTTAIHSPTSCTIRPQRQGHTFS